MRLISSRILALTLPALLLVAGTASAHEGHGSLGGFASGFTHPLFGLDHIVAMFAVGLWAGMMKDRRAVWLLPVVFPVVMALAGIMGAKGVPLPGVEAGIAASAVVLGMLIATAASAPIWAAAGMVGLFAIFHGHAHGTELPAAASPLMYGIGFILATALLHGMGIGTGMLARWPAGRTAVRACGGANACAGLFFLAGVVLG